jgi:hypothetical protein
VFTRVCRCSHIHSILIPLEPPPSKSTQSSSRKQANQFYWKPYFQFQSHEPTFDFLKSLPIEEKINKIQFSKPLKEGVLLLTTNGGFHVDALYSMF